MISIRLQCDCGWWTLCGEAEIVRRLRGLGLFRRAKDPPEDLVREMLRVQGAELTCDRCRQAGLAIEFGASGDDDGEWEQVTVCEICRAPIAAERLEFNPDAKRCVGCQTAADGGATFVEPEYCPRCGALLELRLSRGGGVARYKLWCTAQPPCRL